MAQKVKKPLEPLQTLNFLLTVGIRFGYYCTGDYISKDWTWKWNWRIMNFFICVFISSFCYANTGYQNRKILSEFVFSACLIMIDVMAMQRLMLFGLSQKAILQLYDHFIEFTEKWEQKSEAYPVLIWYYRLLRPVVVVVCGILSVFGVLLGVAPILIYLIFGKMILLFQLFIPHVNYKAHPGFEIHVAFHGLCTFLGITGLVGTTMLMFLVYVQICIEIDVLRARLQVLDLKIKNKKSTEEEILEDLKGIFESHQGLIEYIDDIEDIFCYQNLSDHVVAGVQTCLALYICLQKFWFPGYLLIAIGFVVTFSADLLGTIIETKLETLSTDIYGVPWYLMSVRNQKMFNYFLGNTQKTDRLSLAGRIPLCLDTFVRLYKGIYSYLMVLRETQM